LRAALAAAVVAYSGYSLRANYFVSYKEDSRGAIRYLAARAHQGDCYVGSPPNQDWLIEKAWAIYEPGQPFPLARLSAGGSCPRVWLVSVTHGNFDDPVELANRQRAKLATDRVWIEGQKFFWTAVDLYQPASVSAERSSDILICLRTSIRREPFPLKGTRPPHPLARS
jgi:hypothetical protein